ncbi:MAG TPA: Ig-like domain-containing protein, partial [Bacillota bacterium]|nr:Ig-like domain-containing protein [Bacillota bacterium]
AAGNVDTDFTGTITLTEASAGSLSGITAMDASSGVAVFTDLVYNATADQETFELTATTGTLTTAVSNLVTSDVVATRLIFGTQPLPNTLQSGQLDSFTTVPVIQAVDAQGKIDTGYNSNIEVSVIDPHDGILDGTVNILSGTGDTDGNNTTVIIPTANGIATFTGLSINYTVGGSNANTIALRVTSGSLTAANSNPLTVLAAPAVASVTLPSNGRYRSGDRLDFTINFDNNVTITGGTPYLPITLDTGGIVNATYISGSGSTALVFRYTVVSGNEDLNGVTLGSAITDNGANIQNGEGYEAILTLNGVGSTAGVLVDGLAPTAQITAERSSTNISPIPVTISFNEAVTGLEVGDIAVTNGTVIALSGSGTTYTANITPVGQGAVKVNLADGAVQDAAGN